MIDKNNHQNEKRGRQRNITKKKRLMLSLLLHSDAYKQMYPILWMELKMKCQIFVHLSMPIVIIHSLAVIFFSSLLSTIIQDCVWKYVRQLTITVLLESAIGHKLHTHTERATKYRL